MRTRNKVVLLGTCAALALVSMLVLLPSGAGALNQPANQRVIIVFKDQVKNLPPTRSQEPARRNAVTNVQAPVNSQLKSSGASNIRSYSVLNAISATVSGSEASQLRSNAAVSQVVPDAVIHAPTVGTTSGSGTGTATPNANVCPPAGKTQLNPEALSLIHANSDVPGAQTARSLGYTGSGVSVGFIADGLDINNPDFIRANGQHVFTDYKDFSGEGTNVPTGGEEAFGDASSIAAQGRETYNVAKYGPHAVSTPCNIRVEGVSPGASLVGLDIFGAENTGFNSSFLNAINYAVIVDHVNVLNESLGGNLYPDDPASLDLIKRANDEAVAAGTTVVASSGDAGVTSTIGTPATDPLVISAGATTSYRVDLQTGYGGAQFPGVTGYLDNNISSLSSGGFEQNGHTVDLVAPGELNWALCSTNTKMYSECLSYAGNPTPVIPFGGTSESSPLTAGVAALVIEAYHKTHGTNPSPAQIKQILASTADDIAAPADQQGSGLVDAYKAVQAAASFKAPASSPKATGATLLESAPQLNAVDQPGTPVSLSDTITNNGATTQKLSLATRVLGPYQSLDNTKVTLSDSSSPKTTDWAGNSSNYQPITFTVPAGESRLNASIAYQNASRTDLNARVRLTLVDPSGNLADYSVPQGDGNYGNAQITNPKAGTWTAYVWSKVSSLGGTTGPVLFDAGVARYVSVGKVTPQTLTLAPGQSAPITVSGSTPSTPGDYAGSIAITSDSGPSFGRQTTIPVTLRSLIPMGNESFDQTLTGGNGRQFNVGQSFTYQMDVAAGQRELNAAVKLADNPNNPFSAYLISPDGEALAFASNELGSRNGSFTDELGAQLHVLSPAQGAWTLIVTFAPQVSGTALTEPFTVSTNQAAVPATAAGLPTSPATKLAAGQAQTYNVKVTNAGPAPEAYFLDARTPQSVPMNLVSLNSPNTTVPLTFADNQPEYLVPTHTSNLAVTASTTGSTPIQFDSSQFDGDPDIGSTVGSTVSGSLAADPIAQGPWFVIPTVSGAFGATGAPREPVTTTMTSTSAAFDPTVSSQTGDIWQASTNPGVLDGFSPQIVGPGQTAMIPVTITPKGASGTKVSGTLYLDDYSNIVYQSADLPNGDEVAAIPYSYTVK